ncbi:MAG TPA: cyclopropane fatty acyl phospholipid synthase [Deltaproteobacteria bacterium]|jgi:cyclopropane-fatty-acyl-phospholipid synthase|nr:cyclopropane fatty acyl phospholipid synthase [Deltaproteobacteria bacterium]
MELCRALCIEGVSMAKQDAGGIVQGLLSSAGIAINGDNPWDIRIHNRDVFRRILRDGILGAGESYMDGWWDCPALDQFFDRALRAGIDRAISRNPRLAWHALKPLIINLQRPGRAHEVGIKHYDIGNDLYRSMLDSRMNYTCGYWRGADTLDEAQVAKMDLVCRKAGIEPGMRVLDLGCGWGSFARYAAEKYGAIVTGVTVSRQQVELGKEFCAGLPVDIRLQDYREVEGTYDRVVSIGIMEHVGYRNYRTYMEVVDRTLKSDGVGFFHTIGGNESIRIGNPWTTKYIFPNGQVPSISQLSRAMEGLFVMEDWHNFGPDYDRTLMAWHANFERHWPELKPRYDERFRRMWRFYLLSSAGAFRSRTVQLWQVVMTKPGTKQPDCRHR